MAAAVKVLPSLAESIQAIGNYGGDNQSFYRIMP